MSEPSDGDFQVRADSITGVLVEAARKTLGNSIELILGPKRVRAIGEAKADSSAYAIRRAAEAKAYEIVTLEQARIEAQALHNEAKLPILDRAKDRIISGEILKQENIERVLAGALSAAEREPSVSGSRPIDLEWMLRFVEGAGFVSNEQLQEIWSKILFRQAAPDCSGISIMALDCLRLLDAQLATTFLKAASLLSYISIISNLNLESVINKYPMPERTHLDQLEELGLLERKVREDLYLVVGGTYCVLDERCLESFAPVPRFFSLSIRGFELASALIKGYDHWNHNPEFALEHFTPEQLKREITLLFLNSVTPNDLTVKIWLDLPKQVKFELNSIEEYRSGGNAMFRADQRQPPLEEVTEAILREFLTEQIIWRK